MNDTRRNVMIASVAIVGGMGLGGIPSCTTSNGNVDPVVIDKINRAIVGACNAVGAATTIAALVAAVFPAIAPAALTAAQIGQIAAAFCRAIEKPAGGKYTATLDTVNIDVHGWIVRDNQVIPF